MNINVPAAAREHFWTEPQIGFEEFWAFRFPPKCQVGDTLYFKFDGVPVAQATVSRIEKPGLHECEQSGKYKNSYKVYWRPDSFKDLQ
jgi:hypothetical protein